MGEKVSVHHNWSGEQWDWPLQHNDGIVKVIHTKDKFQIELEAQYFTPNEIEVRATGHLLDIHFCHEARKNEHGAIKREFSRTYHLPPDVDPATVKSHLSARGILTIVAQKNEHYSY